MKATRRLFDEDSRLTAFTAVVLSCEPDGGLYRVLLDQTAFFPEEGGQSCDRGTLAGYPVSRVREETGVITHWLAQPLEPGTEVTGEIDWEKRFSDMQQHTGEHIVSGLVHALYGYDNVGFHLGSEYVTMDYSGPLSPAQLHEVEERANRAVWANLPVSVTWPSPQVLETLSYRSKKELEGDIRIVEIPGVDRCACCAPHVLHTGEIGLIKLIASESYKGGVRVYMLCGSRALADYNRKQENTAGISALFSAKPDEILPAVRRQKEECESLRFEVNRLKMELISSRIAQLSEEKCVCLFDPNLDRGNNRRAWNLLCERFPESICATFSGSDEKGFQFILGGGGRDARESGKELMTAFSGKGGGSAQMFQGQLRGSQKEIEKYLKNLLTNTEL